MVNPEQYVATVADGHTLEMEFPHRARPRDYRAVERSKDDAHCPGLYPDDSIFMPVRKVNYSVEEVVVSGSMQRDRLTIGYLDTLASLRNRPLEPGAGHSETCFMPLKECHPRTQI